MLNVAETLEGKRLLFVGATGFVGKVALSLLLRQFPGVGKVFVLVRPGAGSTSEDRFFRKVVRSPVFDPIREQWGDKTDEFLRDKVVPLAGDAARPLLNFTEEDFARFGKLDAIVNCAGLVSFTPSLEIAIRINTFGVRNVLDVARRTGGGVIHISTCFVAGNRSGDVWEDETLHGYHPRRAALRDADFHVDAEIADCERLIAQVKTLADDRQHVSLFRERGAERLTADGRDADDEHTLKIAVARERKLWVSERLTELGMERAKHWGWPNIYTYTKSLGDQVLAAQSEVPFSIVRPSIVESALRYPFPGWNEGFTTSAPLVFFALKGHRSFPAHPDANLDIVPCDQLASVIIGATAAVIAGTHEPVYQAATGDVAPLPVPRAVELVGLFARRHWRDRKTGNRLTNYIRSRLEPVPVSRSSFELRSAPAFKSVADRVVRALDAATPSWGAPSVQALAARARGKLEQVVDVTGKTREAFELFMPFVHDNHYVFRSDQVRKLFASMTPEDRRSLRWDPENIEWRSYWLDLHLPGLEKWVFPDLEEEFEPRAKAPYQYKDLLELFDATCKRHASRTALRLLPPPGSDEPPQRVTYRQLDARATRGAAHLRDAGVATGERVLLLSENRPEWVMTCFATLRAGGVLVPMDEKATPLEIVNVLRTSRAKVAVLSERLARKHHGLAARLTEEGLATVVRTQDELFLADARSVAGAIAAEPKGDSLASLIFTSGTTGNPKGVMLSHRNFTSLVAKLTTVFELGPHDRLLSVLPLHHTFEFTAGLLMPLSRGAQVTYLGEVTPEALEAAFEEGHVTSMIGVPALWQLLHRKVRKRFGDRGPWVEEAFDAVVEGSRLLREKSGINLGKIIFWPVHQKLGRGMRLLVSGGSALPPEVMKSFQGLGFSLYEGYGLTESAPVLTSQRPGAKNLPGSVGEALPGVELRIADPDASGVGEVHARGPNVMMGYFENDAATAEVLEEGWLKTGDLGRLDEEGRLFIVGRRKELILGSNGENVYPDELEELYGDASCVKELSVVGLPEADGPGEQVACLLVPAADLKGDDGEPLSRSEVRERCQEHVRQVSARLPQYKRIKVLHLWEHDLPRTSTRKVKRRLVVEELQRLARAVARASEAAAALGGAAASGDEWLFTLVASVCQKPRERVRAEATMAELGFDSLMLTELGVALEAAGVAPGEDDDDRLVELQTVADLLRLIGARRGARAMQAPARRPTRASAEPAAGEAAALHVPAPLVAIGTRALEFGQRMAYERLFRTKVTGSAYLPKTGSFIVAANHASHLDMGLIKHALGDWGGHLASLAAKDYFFGDRLKRAYFENFTNLVPMDRHGSLRESLRLAAQVLREGRVLLIFPEGTRSETGVMSDFKASVGYLALVNQVDVLPIYLEGTFDALPKGASLPGKRDLCAHIGPVLRHGVLREATASLPKSEQYREAARLIEVAVRKLGKLPPLERKPATRGTEERPA